MESLGNLQQQLLLLLPSEHYFMNPLLLHHLRGRATLCSLRSSSAIVTRRRCFCNLTSTQKDPIPRNNNINNGGKAKAKAKAVRAKKVLDAQLLKDNWLNSLACPQLCDQDGEVPGQPNNSWVIGVDPDVSGALAVLKTDPSGGCSAQVFDSPHLKVLIGNRIRRRLDTTTIVQMLRSLDAPIGTTAYIEQSLPYPQDGKQGWWCGGFNYGLWIGVLVASEFSVVPVPSLRWKSEFKLSGNGSSKDDSREVASTLFPSIASLLRRKKDHGRAEALLIAAYGKGVKLSSDVGMSLKRVDALKN